MIELLRELLPVLAPMVIKNEATRLLVTRLTDIAEREVSRRMNQTGKTRAEALAEFGEQWDKDIAGGEALKALPDNTP